MATLEETQLPPIDPVASVAPVPILGPTTTSAVYSPSNVSQIDLPSNGKAGDMKLADLEKKLSNASSLAELNQINIMNQPKAMGVLTGESAHQSRLDAARLNAFNSLYQNRLADEQRKEEKRQQFITTYGADPNQRPKGMSSREFEKAIQGGQFQDLITEDFKQKQLETKAKQKALAGGSGTVGEKIGAVGANAQNKLLASRGDDGKVDPNTYMQQRAEYINAGGLGSKFDSEFGMLLSSEEKQKLGISGASSVDQWVELLATGQASVSNVPQDIRNNVITAIANSGSTVTKQLSDSAIKEVTQTQSALGALDNLEKQIELNLEFIGPISGLQKYNPWSKSRQIQADVDRVRQVVGKALEGGVLRKEDEEKYKKILATLTDTPETALYKITALRGDLERNIAEYKLAQSKAGRYVPGVSNVNQEDLRTKYNY